MSYCHITVISTNRKASEASEAAGSAIIGAIGILFVSAVVIGAVITDIPALLRALNTLKENIAAMNLPQLNHIKAYINDRLFKNIK